MSHVKAGTAAALALTLSLAGCGAAEQAEQQAESGTDTGKGKTLTVSVFGGSWGTAIEDNIITPFEREHDVTIRAVESTSTVALGKLRQDPGAFDVALLDSGVSELARSEDLVATLPPDELSNVGELSQQALMRDDEGLWAVTMGFWALGLAYNTEEVQDPPTSWSDLWDASYAGKVTVPTPATTGGLPLLVQAAQLNGGSIGNVDPGFAALAKLDAAAFFDSSGTAANLLQSGEAVIAADYNAGAWPLADQGLPIKWVAPKEGALAAASRWHITSRAGDTKLAAQFIDFASSAAAQQGLAEDLYVAPANTNVDLPARARERMPYGSTGSLQQMTFLNWQDINANRSQWTQQWNKQVAR